MGVFLWANAYLMSNKAALYCAQFVMGVGSGSLGVTRSYIVEQVEPQVRTNALSLLTALQYAGFTVSPLIGSLLSSIADINSFWAYALPAYGVGFFTVLSLSGLLLHFKDLISKPVPSQDTAPATVRQNKSSSENAWEMRGVILLMMMLNVSTKGSIAVYETLGSQMGLVDYNLSSMQLGMLVSVSGAVGFVQLLVFERVWTPRFSDVQLVLGGTAVMMMAQFLVINYGTNDTSLAAYIAAVVLMYAVGYPIAHTAALGGFAKIQKSGPQAALMGWFATAGSAARIVLPVVSGYLDTFIENGPFSIVLAILAASYVAVVVLENKIRYYIEDSAEDRRQCALTALQRAQVIGLSLVFLFGCFSLLLSTSADPGD
jgi:ceroid-lipofuscinosis MFS transporter 7